MASANLYDTLHATATEFVISELPETAGGKTISRARILATRTASCKTTWGPRYFVKPRPYFQGEMTNEEFLSHLEGMIKQLETWKIEIGSIVIDEKKLQAVVQADYFMTPAGTGPKESRTVVNDIVWFLRFTGDGKFVDEAKEYVDVGASEAIREIIMAAKS
jgi:hypothetical protein